MKFEKIDGVQHVIIEDNDVVSITTPDALGSSSLTLKIVKVS